MNNVSRLFLLFLSLYGYAGPAVGQLQIAETSCLPKRLSIPANVEVYVLGKKCADLEFTWDKDRDAVYVNDALFYAGPAYIPPDSELVNKLQNNGFVRYHVETNKMSLSDAYRLYKKKWDDFHAIIYPAAADLQSRSVPESTIVKNVTLALAAGDFGHLINMEYGVRIIDGTLVYKSVNSDSEISYLYMSGNVPTGPWRADAAIEGIAMELSLSPDLPRIIIFTGGSHIVASGVKETERINRQIYDSRASGKAVPGPLPPKVIAAFLNR